MNSGLYALAGVSATAKAAAWAKRLDCPITNESNTYLGFSRAELSHSESAGLVSEPLPVLRTSAG